jgi:acyl carrier protein
VSELEIRESLRRAFADAWIGLETDLDHDLALDDIEGLDSVSRVRLMLTVEEAFGIEMSPAEHGRLKSIGDLVDLIRSKVEGRLDDGR